MSDFRPAARARRRAAGPLFGTVERALRLLGYRAGAPPSVPAEARKVDELTCRRLRCPRCRRRGLKCHAYHHPERGGYRVLGACPEPGCGGVEEV